MEILKQVLECIWTMIYLTAIILYLKCLLAAYLIAMDSQSEYFKNHKVFKVIEKIFLTIGFIIVLISVFKFVRR